MLTYSSAQVLGKLSIRDSLKRMKTPISLSLVKCLDIGKTNPFVYSF